jgi:hypothetical protein
VSIFANAKSIKSMESFMSRLISLVFAVSIVGASTAALATPAPERVRGTVKSVSDTVLVVHTTSGSDETVNLTGATGFLEVTKSNLNRIEKGSYIGTATKSIGDKQVALGSANFSSIDEGRIRRSFRLGLNPGHNAFPRRRYQ